MLHVTLRQLRVFQSVAATRNFSRTGEQVGLTQPAVSRAIGELESQLGIRLLDRTTREVELTEAGRGLAARLDRVLDELDQALSDTQGLATQRQGRVRVASNPTISAHLMPQCIAACRAAHPGIAVVLSDRVQQDVLAGVRNGEVDFGVVADPGDTPDLHTESLLTEPFGLVCPPGHRFAAMQRVPWKSLARERLVLLGPTSGSRRLIDAALADLGVDATVAMELGHPTTVFEMVVAGLGVSVMPALALGAARAMGLQTRPLSPAVHRGIALVRRRNRALGPLAQRVWDLVGEVARQQAGTQVPR